MIEMVLVLGQDRRCVVPVDDEHAVEEFAADAGDEPFGDGVGRWCWDRCLDHSDPDGGEDRVEGGSELGVAVADEERKR